MRILVTGANGFIGRNLLAALAMRREIEADRFDLDCDPGSLAERVRRADLIVHLAGVNRPRDEAEYRQGNAGLTSGIVAILELAGRAVPFVLSSSTQAVMDNPYGRSKRAAEDAVFAYRQRSGARVCVYRLPNVFGKWGRPHYNSAVATFCHQIARDLPIQVSDPDAVLTLVYIDDLVAELLRAIDGCPTADGEFCRVPVSHEVKLGELAERIRAFRAGRRDLTLPDFSDPFSRKLYATYLSCLPGEAFIYPLNEHRDARGSFSEFLRTPERGQISVNISKPGMTKGNHWHHTKVEKFLVISGRGIIRFRKIGTTEVIRYAVSGEKLEVVDIPPGYTHNITNNGDSDMATVMWASEPFDPARPDTMAEEVER